MSDILLIHAGIGNCGFNCYGKGMDQSWINHGLASIGSYVQSRGHTYDYLDLRRLTGWTQFSGILAEKKPRIIGLSGTTVDYDIVVKAVPEIRKILPSIRIILGGVHASVCPEECSQTHLFDHIIIGEGEQIVSELIENSANDTIIQGTFIEELDSLPFINRTVFGNNERTLYKKLFPEPFTTFIASRGCPYNCAFCQPAEKIVFGKKMRTRSPENLVSEIAQCKSDMNIQSYLIHDDCLLWSENWVSEFVLQLNKQGICLPFAIQARADLICRYSSLIEELSQAGLRMILIGFESGSQRILNFLRKGTTVEQNIQAAEICRKNKVAIWANYMLGIPGEELTDVEKTVSMIRSIHPEVCSPSFFTPYPGSYLEEYCAEKDLSLISKQSEYRRDPYIPKIKNIDYKYLKKMVRLSKNETIMHCLWHNTKRTAKKILLK